LASSAFSHFFIVSRSWRSHTQRTPTGETLRPRFLQLVGDADLPEGRLRDGERHDRLLDLGRHPVLQNRRLAADLDQRQLTAFVVEFLEGVDAVATTAHPLAGLAAIAELPGELQKPSLGADGLPLHRLGVLPRAGTGRRATPTAPRPASARNGPCETGHHMSDYS